MRKALFLFSLYLISYSSFSQQITELQRSLDSLKLLKESYQDKINEYSQKISGIEKEYSSIEKMLVQKRFEQSAGESFFCVGSTGIYRTPDGNEMLTLLKKGSTVKVLGQNENNYKVIYNDVTGWVLKTALLSEIEYNKKLEKEKTIAIAENQKQKEQQKAESTANQANIKTQEEAQTKRKAELIRKYGATDAQRISNGKIWLGMSDEMARASWGAPENINRTVGSWGVHEQWIYGDTYVYFENGKLTVWQDSK